MSYKVKVVSPIEFYNHCISKDFALYDLRENSLYEQERIEDAIRTDANVDDYGFERKDKILMYDNEKHNHKNREIEEDADMLKIVKDLPVKATKYLKEILVLDNFDEFKNLYPYLMYRSNITASDEQKEEDDGEASMFECYPSQILDFMFLSGFYCATQRNTLKKMGIKYILNATQECKNEFEHDGIVYLQIPILDSHSQDLEEAFDLAIQFIKKAKEDHSKVLVHCAQGRSRSASLVAAYLMKEHDWSLNDTMEYIKRMRPIVQPNSSFSQQLLEFEYQLRGRSKKIKTVCE